MMIKRFFVVLFITVFTGCKNEKSIDNIIEEKYNINTLNYKLDFPKTIYTHKKHKGTIQFYNTMLDTIARPRRDTTNFRFIIYKPFIPHKDGDNLVPVYKDSVLLDDNIFNIELEFDEAGIYNIGGLARDAMRMNYFTNGLRDSARFIEHEIIFMEKIIVKDSI